MILVQSQVSMPLMKLPVLSIVFEIGKSRILFSPGSKLTLPDYVKIGSVTDIIAPNLLHGGGVKGALQFSPEAEVWGVPGCREQKPEIPWTKVLGEDIWPYGKDLPFIQLRGIPSLNEVVFFDQTSKALFVTDMVFNMKETKGPGAWIILNIFGTYKRLAMSRLYKSAIKDKKAFTDSLNQIMAWDFDSIYMSHGEPVTEGGKAKLKAALKERGF